jgi:hypothetical protein
MLQPLNLVAINDEKSPSKAVFDKARRDPFNGVLPHSEILYADNSCHAKRQFNEKLEFKDEMSRKELRAQKTTWLCNYHSKYFY